MKTTTRQLVEEIYNAFEKATRSDGKEFYRLKEDAPAWLTTDFRFMHSIHEALDDRAPDDWVYESAYHLALKLLDYGHEDVTTDQLREVAPEVAGGLVDVYNLELTKWLASHLFNIDLVNEAIEECGFDKESGITTSIQQGQQRAYEKMADALINAVDDELTARNGEDE